MGFIYKIRNKVDNKIYIGQTTRDLNLRWKEHLRKNSNCRYLSSAIKKYGFDNFEFKIVCITFDEKLDNIEIEYIQKYNSLVPNGYNLRNGGNGGKHNEETKIKISESLKNRTDIIYKKPQLGIPLNEETKNKISLKLTGRKLSESTIEKIKNSNTKYTVLQLDIDGNIINKFFGCVEAGKYIGTTKENINMCCNGKRKTTKRYVFKECLQ
jgi:group I intron endonuclease